MNYQIKRFSELTTKELYKILKVRAEVFIVGQNCVFQDLDSKDEVSYHLFLEDNSEITAYLRILPKGIAHPETAIGRVLTKEAYRKRGLSREIVQKAIDFITDILEEKEIRISAQAYLQEFYESFGFEAISDIYLYERIEHIEMLYQKKDV